MEAQKRTTFDYYEESGRKFKLNAFDPLEGNYILTQVLTFAMPMGLSSMLSIALGERVGTEGIIPELGISNQKMSKRDFIELQRDVLKTVEEVYPSGETSPVIRENGTFGVENLSMKLSLNLIIASIAYNFKDFFGDVPSIDSLVN